MSKRLSYADAAKLIGGESAVVEALNKATGGLLLTATGGGSELALSLFDAKGELAGLSAGLVTGLADRLRGLSRYDRTDRLAAAQRVLVLTAYFDTVRQTELPFDRAQLRLSRPVEVTVATGRAWERGSLGALAGILLDTDIPSHGEHAMSPVHAMTRLLLLSSSPAVTSVELLEAYWTCLFVINESCSTDYDSASRSLAVVLRQLAADRDRLTDEQRARLLGSLTDMLETFPRTHPVVAYWAREAFGQA